MLLCVWGILATVERNRGNVVAEARLRQRFDTAQYGKLELDGVHRRSQDFVWGALFRQKS